jgi:hypothetical protein
MQVKACYADFNSDEEEVKEDETGRSSSEIKSK